VYCGQLFIDLFVGLAFSIVIHVPSPSVWIVLVRLVKKCDILLIQDKPAALPGKIIRPPHLVLNPALDLVGSKRRGFFQVQSVQIGREKKLGNLLSQPMSRCYPWWMVLFTKLLSKFFIYLGYCVSRTCRRRTMQWMRLKAPSEVSAVSSPPKKM
jgi:hypothetical protein